MIVILYVMDSLRSDFLSCYGYPKETSPQIDRLASEGALFVEGFAQSTWTRASGASILTSTYPSSHGILNTGDYFRRALDSLPAALRRRGFRTIALTTMRNISPYFGFGDGFDLFIEVYKNEKIAAKRVLRKEGNKLPVCTSEDINTLLFPMLEEGRRRDTFFFVWSLDTHDPYFHRDEKLTRFAPLSTEPLWARQIVDMHHPQDVQRLRLLYEDMIFHNDYHIGVLIDKLKTMNLFDEALFVLTSDHGEAFGEHGMNSHGGLPYEELIRIPLIIKFPHGDFRGRVSGMVQHIDIAPTLLAYLFDSSNGFSTQGKSVLPLLQTGREPNEFVIVETQVQSRLPRSTAIRTHGFKYIEMKEAKVALRKRIREGPHTWFRRAQRLLFDLQEDPGEMCNLIMSRHPLAKELAAILSRSLRENRVMRKSLFTGREKPPEADPEVARQLKALGYLD